MISIKNLIKLRTKREIKITNEEMKLLSEISKCNIWDKLQNRDDE